MKALKRASSIIGIIILGLVGGCFGCLFVASLLPDSTRTPVAPVSDVAESLADDPRPTEPPTKSPTSTPVPEPTATPIPSATPHIAPLYPTIAAEYNEMTDIQQERYLETFAGAEAIEWTGKVEEVSEFLGTISVYVDAGRETAGFDVALYDIDEDIAITLNVGDTITFSGRIRDITTVFGLLVTIDDATIHSTEGD